ncbi:VanZ family protein [Planococcus sp. YIM B11945]|uniref:VanZ family protein n=1 Tax=Planococcus sp. YIM B11945 TaxID=3435410 RepID=UPI003D7C96FB
MIREYKEKGFTQEQAVARALREFGDVETIQSGLQDTVHPNNKILKSISWILFNIYTAIGLWFLLFERMLYRLVNWGSSNWYFWYPEGTSTFFGAEVWKLNTNIIPFLNTYNYLVGSQHYNLDIILFNTLGNILIFVPLGIFLSFLFSRFRTFSKVMMIGFMVTVSIELLQFFLQLGQFDIDDILLNTIGALLGYFVYKSIRKVWNTFQAGKTKKAIH